MQHEENAERCNDGDNRDGCLHDFHQNGMAGRLAEINLRWRASQQSWTLHPRVVN